MHSRIANVRIHCPLPVALSWLRSDCPPLAFLCVLVVVNQRVVVARESFLVCSVTNVGNQMQ